MGMGEAHQETEEREANNQGHRTTISDTEAETQRLLQRIEESKARKKGPAPLTIIKLIGAIYTAFLLATIGTHVFKFLLSIALVFIGLCFFGLLAVALYVKDDYGDLIF